MELTYVTITTTTHRADVVCATCHRHSHQPIDASDAGTVTARDENSVGLRFQAYRTPCPSATGDELDAGATEVDALVAAI